MKKFLLQSTTFAVFVGLTFLSFAPITLGQGASKQPNNISDKELKAFVAAYVEYQEILMEYEPSLRDLQDTKEKERFQKEANSKVEMALKYQGVSAESYNRIFTAVNNNEDLRKRTLKMIDAERKRLKS